MTVFKWTPCQHELSAIDGCPVCIIERQSELIRRLEDENGELQALPSTSGWHYPAHNLDLDNMPQPGEIVVVYYRNGENICGPTIMTPIHDDGHHTIAGLSIYQPIVRWCRIPAE
jgi:hypothetical protein